MVNALEKLIAVGVDTNAKSVAEFDTDLGLQRRPPMRNPSSYHIQNESLQIRKFIRRPRSGEQNRGGHDCPRVASHSAQARGERVSQYYSNSNP